MWVVDFFFIVCGSLLESNRPYTRSTYEYIIFFMYLRITAFYFCAFGPPMWYYSGWRTLGCPYIQCVQQNSEKRKKNQRVFDIFSTAVAAAAVALNIEIVCVFILHTHRKRNRENCEKSPGFSDRCFMHPFREEPPYNTKRAHRAYIYRPMAYGRLLTHIDHPSIVVGFNVGRGPALARACQKPFGTWQQMHVAVWLNPPGAAHHSTRYTPLKSRQKEQQQRSEWRRKQKKKNRVTQRKCSDEKNGKPAPPVTKNIRCRRSHYIIYMYLQQNIVYCTQHPISNP